MVKDTIVVENYRVDRQLTSFRSLRPTAVSKKRQKAEEYTESVEKSDDLYGIPEFLKNIYHSLASADISPKDIAKVGAAGVVVGAAVMGGLYLKDKAEQIHLNPVAAFGLTGYDFSDFVGSSNDGMLPIAPKDGKKYNPGDVSKKSRKGGSYLSGMVVRAAPVSDYKNTGTGSYEDPLTYGSEPNKEPDLLTKIMNAFRSLFHNSGTGPKEIADQAKKTMKNQGGANLNAKYTPQPTYTPVSKEKQPCKDGDIITDPDTKVGFVTCANSGAGTEKSGASGNTGSEQVVVKNVPKVTPTVGPTATQKAKVTPSPTVIGVGGDTAEKIYKTQVTYREIGGNGVFGEREKSFVDVYGQDAASEVIESIALGYKAADVYVKIHLKPGKTLKEMKELQGEAASSFAMIFDGRSGWKNTKNHLVAFACDGSKCYVSSVNDGKARQKSKKPEAPEAQILESSPDTIYLKIVGIYPDLKPDGRVFLEGDIQSRMLYDDALEIK